MPATHAFEIYSKENFKGHAYTYTLNNGKERDCINVWDNTFNVNQ